MPMSYSGFEDDNPDKEQERLSQKGTAGSRALNSQFAAPPAPAVGQIPNNPMQPAWAGNDAGGTNQTPWAGAAGPAGAGQWLTRPSQGSQVPAGGSVSEQVKVGGGADQGPVNWGALAQRFGGGPQEAPQALAPPAAAPMQGGAAEGGQGPMGGTQRHHGMLQRMMQMYAQRMAAHQPQRGWGPQMGGGQFGGPR